MAKSRNTTSITEFKHNKENPFIKDAVEKIENKIVKKYKNSAGYGEKAVLKAVDPDTGEMLGHTTFIRQVKIDEDQFAKIYLSNFSAFYELKPQAIKVFGYILNQLIPNKDQFMFFHEDCLEFTGYKSQTSIRIGLTSLLKNDIIARGRNDSLYFINPMIVFNGNRVTFAKTYVKNQKEKEEIKRLENEK